MLVSRTRISVGRKSARREVMHVTSDPSDAADCTLHGLSLTVTSAELGCVGNPEPVMVSSVPPKDEPYLGEIECKSGVLATLYEYVKLVL